MNEKTDTCTSKQIRVTEELHFRVMVAEHRLFAPNSSTNGLFYGPDLHHRDVVIAIVWRKGENQWLGGAG